MWKLIWLDLLVFNWHKIVFTKMRKVCYDLKIILTSDYRYTFVKIRNSNSFLISVINKHNFLLTFLIFLQETIVATQLVPVVPQILDQTIPVILIRWMSKWFGDLNYYSRVSSDIILWSRWSQKICDLIAVFFLQMIEYVQFFWPFSSGCLPRLRDFQREAFEKKRPKGQRLPFEMVSTHCIPYMLAYGSTLVIYQVADFSWYQLISDDISW